MVRQLLVSLLCAVGVAAHPLSARAGNDFALFAYGHELGGHPIVEKEGVAYIIRTPVPTNCRNVTFHSDEDRKLEAQFGGNPAKTLFAVPNAPGLVRFVPDASNATMLTTGFRLYDSFLFLDTPDNGMATDWFARPVPGAIDTWELGWKFDSDNAVPVTLRTMAPFK